MLKALRIASVAAIAAAVGVVVFVALFGLKEDAAIEEFLQSDGIVEQIRKKVKVVAQKSDADSPLEAASKAFALRIDPPPPPAPIEPAKPSQPIVKPPSPPQPPRPPENRQPTLSAKFTLEATARCPDQPQKSMVLLKNVQNEFKWYRQGEQVGHLEIQEVKDGSVVLYQGGKYNSELFMPAQPKVRSLLKGEDYEPQTPRGPVAVTLPGEFWQMEPADQEQEEIAAEPIPAAVGPGARRTIPSRLDALREGRASAPRSAMRTTPPRPYSPAPPPTLEEQKKSLDESISSIQEIMNKPALEGQSEEERIQEQEAWQQLIKVLNAERQAIEQTGEEEAADSQ